MNPNMRKSSYVQEEVKALMIEKEEKNNINNFCSGCRELRNKSIFCKRMYNKITGPLHEVRTVHCHRGFW